MRPRGRCITDPLRISWPFMVAGVLAAAVLLGLADLLAQLFRPSASPFIALGSGIIEVSPGWLQEFAISTLGSANTTVLYLCMVVGGVALAALIGVSASRSRVLGGGLFSIVAAGLASVVALRPETSASDLVPTAAGVLLGLAVLVMLTRSAGSFSRRGHKAAEPESQQSTQQAQGGESSRRVFLSVAAGAAVLAGASLALGRTAGRLGRGVRDAATRLILPNPAVRAMSIPDDATVGVDGVEPFITPNDVFYRIDTALAVPELEPEEWTLRIHGMVEEEITLDMNELLDLPLEEHHITLTCVSNPVGGDLLGTATWLGFPVRELLARARPLGEADMVLSTSVDGFTASTPLEALTDSRDSLLAVGMNGEPLPRQHGYPARLVVPGLYGFVSATKWVTDLELTRFDRDTAYWTDRGWDEKAPVLVASRIDVPSPLEVVSPGDVVIAGSAWAQQDGISAVQVSVDDEDWQEADLASEVSVDTWRQWRYVVPEAAAGRHSVSVRAVTASGEVQTGKRRDPIPNAATGRHRIEFRVE